MTTKANVAPLGYAGILAQHVALFGASVATGHTALYSLALTRVLAHTAPYTLTKQVLKAHLARYAMRTVNEVRLTHIARWSLLNALVRVVTAGAYLMAGATRMEMLECSLAQDEGGHWWQASIRLGSAGDYMALQRHDAINLYVLGDVYEMVVESKGRTNTRTRTSIEQAYTLTCKSRLWLPLGEDAPLVTHTYSAVGARATVEALAGEAVDWRIVDWIIPAGKLAAAEQPPIEIIETIAKAAGAVVESARDGTLVVRYLYPVTIPDAPTVVTDHDFTEDFQFSLSEQDASVGTVANKFIVSNKTDDAGFLQAERDPEQSDVILGGEQQRFIVYTSEDVDVQQVILSDGELVTLGTTLDEDKVEELAFENEAEAQLSKPVYQGVFSHTWFGTSLGALTLQPDGRTLTAAGPGVAIARVVYTAQGQRYAVLAPVTSGGQVEFPVLVYIIGVLKDTGSASRVRVAVERGAGDVQGDDIVEPLANAENVLVQNGRNAIDAATRKALVTLAIPYESEADSGGLNVLNGQLVAVVDTQLGQTWRGKVTDVHHRITRKAIDTDLRIERFFDA